MAIYNGGLSIKNVSVGTATGSGNAITSLSADGNVITPDKGSTFLTAQDISGKEDESNKVTAWSSTTTHEHYPSEKLVKDALDGKANEVHNHDEYYYRKEKVTEMIQDPTANTPGVCVGYGLDILGGY